MSRARHAPVNRAKGGRTDMKVSGNPDVFKEAEGKESYDKGDERKHGGRTKKRATGGKVLGLMTGGAAMPRMDRASRTPGRKRGGGVGADTSPLSSAHKGSMSSEKLPKEMGGN
jgi:hypothetical protein